MLAEGLPLTDYHPPYILLTPGPLSTSNTVKQAMYFDSCTWDDDYKTLVTNIRQELLAIAQCDPSIYTTVLMQGSGTFGVEAVLGSSMNKNDHCVLILQNGVYGKRMTEIAKVLGLPHIICEVPENETFNSAIVSQYLDKYGHITHIAMVHCETTTGLLNPLEEISELAKKHKKYFIVDAMSSFGGIEFDITKLNIDFMISSANKCIQGVPGFSFVICKQQTLQDLCQNQAKSLSLDLYGQWKEMENNHGKWRYTSPTHVVLAFHQALLELKQEGGIPARAKRYQENQQRLAHGMQNLGFDVYISPELQSSIITSFLEPEYVPGTQRKFSFIDFYSYLKTHGFVIYPGKISHRNSFRIGSIGHLFPEDVLRFLLHVQEFINQHNK